MKRTALFIPIATLVMALLIVSVAVAQTGGGYDLSWNVVASGGGSSNGGSYSLNGTIGQAGAGSLSGGNYTLSGGFWISSIAPQYEVYLPLVRK